MYRFGSPPNNGSNPFGNFNPMTTNTQMNMSSGSNHFAQAYSMPMSVIPRPDFRNTNTTLHNNLSDDLLLEQVQEYYINIDSADRKTATYPNPFRFTVTFNSTGSSSVGAVSSRNGKKYYEGTPGPVIDMPFKNVKYIKLDYVILPKTPRLDFTNEEATACNPELCKLTSDEDYFFSSHKYLVLRIPELESQHIMGTNKNISRDSFILYPDKFMGKNHLMWLTTWGNRIFESSKLGNLDRLTFELLDPDGNQFVLSDNSNNEININTDERFSCTPEKPETNQYNKYIAKNMQMSISLIVGVVQNELNTSTKYCP